jgi:predicted molibdopterin-dependent oxidoreductase YjgC
MRVNQSGPDLPAVRRGQSTVIIVDGKPIDAFEGESIAGALLAEGITAFRQTAKRHEPRGLFCGIGLCYECLVTVNGVPNVRACITPLAQGMVIETTSSSGVKS